MTVSLFTSVFQFVVLQARKWNLGAESYGKTCQIGDIVGCMLDLHDRTISKC